jgi:small subunit ribosomal protein S6
MQWWHPSGSMTTRYSRPPPPGALIMATPPRVYDLMLVLSTSVDEERRAKILSDLGSQISSGGGTVERQDDWRTRPLSYEIRHQREGEYHLLQFTGPTALIDAVSHTLRIDDAVLRFRVIKVLPGTPPPPDAAPPVLAGAAPAAFPAAALASDS